MSQSRKPKKELEDLQAGEKYKKIYHSKKAKSDDEGETIVPGKDEKRKNDFLTHFRFTFMSTHLHDILSPKKVN